jgi:hypothetical protein
MALTLELALLPVPDMVLVEALVGIVDAVPGTKERETLNWRVLEGDNNGVPIRDILKSADLQNILSQSGEILHQCEIGFVLQGIGNCSVLVSRLSDGTAQLKANFADPWNTLPSAKAHAVIAIRKAFDKFLRSKSLAIGNPALDDFYTQRDSSLVRLESLNSKIIAENDEHRRGLEHGIESERNRLDELHQAKLDALEAEYRAKTEAVDKRKESLDEREKSLDDRDNTHARRQIQLDLKQILKDRNVDFSLTQKTVNKRVPAMVAFLALISVTAVSLFWALWATTQSIPEGTPSWYPILRVGLSLLAFGSAVVFYIRWQDRWADAHASEEFRLKRFDLDIARASWLVEVMLEASRVPGGERELMPGLIEKLASGLFELTPSGPLVRHPAEEMLAALLSSSGSVNLKLPGGDLNLDRKGIKTFSKKTE